MMHDTVTTSPSPATGFSKTNISSRDILAATNGSRRPQSVGMQNTDRSVLTSSSNANGGEWDIADDFVKLQLADGGAEPKSHTVTPQSRSHLGIVGIESSPLETSSETSIGSSNSSSPFEQTVNLLSHSRGSSADTTVSSHTSGFSASSQGLHPFTPLKSSNIGESRNRPHSYSGGLSKDDLVRLSQVGTSPAQDTWYSPNGTPERLSQPEQPSYPTITGHGNMGRHEQQPMMPTPRVDDLQVDYQVGQQRQFSPLQQATMAQTMSLPAPPFPHSRSNTISGGTQFRQRNFNPPAPTLLQSPPNFGYPAPLHPAAAISMNGGQQIYDMMLPTPPLENPTMARLQQQTPYRGGHQHSASDPASLRDPATLALLNNGMQAAFAAGQIFGPGMVPPNVAMFSQFYGSPEAYSTPDLNLMSRIQPQYTGQYGIGPGRNATPTSAPLTVQLTGSAQGGSTGTSAANRKQSLYKTELCRSWEEKGSCRYGAKCQFAHGEDELRLVSRHPKYKTEICRTFWVSGTCPYGKRCCFIHTEVPGAGQPGQEPPNLSAGEGRPRSDSDSIIANSSEHSSLLNRIRTQESSASKSSSVSNTPPAIGRPGSLRLDTSVVDPAASKQNKSAFPTFTHNGILMPSNDEAPSMSPGPVTAAPDFGRHASARMEIVGTQRRKSANLDPNLRHSFNGSEVQLDFSATTPTASNQAQYNVSADIPSRTSRINGHVRSGSAGNWGSATRSSLSAYPLSSIPGGELKTNMPWAEPVSRVAENSWV